MARIVKEYDERFTEFLDAAQHLFFSIGYEQTSVQDIIQAVGVAKGTFYHYFDSKVDLLDAVVKRTRGQVLKSVMPIVEDRSLNAIAKLERFFSEINNWKLDNHAIVLNMLRILYQDENALLRLKMFEETRMNVAEAFSEIIAQGVAENVFDATHPYETAAMILRMTEMPSTTLVTVLLNGHYDADSVAAMKREVAVFNRSIERVLGLKGKTFDLISEDDLTDWLSLLEHINVDETVS